MEQAATIELKVEKVAQLFDTLDPLPFRERDLDREAEDYIVSWARELPRGAPIRILVHLPAAETTGEEAAALGPAMTRYFQYRADHASGELKELFRLGRFSLAVGLVVLGVCLLLGRVLTRNLALGELGRFLNEGLIILGWVANWRPIEIFLYEWWPLVRRRGLFRRLAQAQVLCRPQS
jgi:hypothetical protein